MALDWYSTERSYVLCARTRVRARQNKGLMKLFTPLDPLEEVSMDLLGPLIKTKRGLEFLLVIRDRLYKLTRAIPLKNTLSLAVSKAFLSHFVFSHGARAQTFRAMVQSSKASSSRRLIVC